MRGSRGPRVDVRWAGQRVAVTETLTSIRYAYDPLGRLTDAEYTDGRRFQYAYDYSPRSEAEWGGVGNRTQATQTITQTTVTNYTYDTAQRLTAVNGQPYSWDQAGRLQDDGRQQYSYDQNDRLLAVTAPGLAWRAGYDGDGVRLWQVANGAAITYTLDLAAPLVTVLAEQQADNQTTYVYGRGDSPLASEDGGTWRYLTGRDALNSVRQETDAAGAVLAVRRFDPYGVPLEGDGGQPYGYAGESWDGDVQLQWLRARWYQPATGRFLSRDSWTGVDTRPLSYHPWLYGAGNPVTFADASGHDPLDATWRGDFEEEHGRPPGVLDEQIRLFSLAYRDEWVGGGLAGAFYHRTDGSRNFHTLDPDTLPEPDSVNVVALKRAFEQPPPSRSWDTMPSALVSLSQHYQAGEEPAFVRDVALLYAGMPGRSQSTGLRPYYSVGAWNSQIFIQAGSINRNYVESTIHEKDDADANVHHWAWAFATGYNLPAGVATLVNRCRELGYGEGPPWARRVDESDIEMGNRGAEMGAAFRSESVGYREIPDLFRRWLGIGGAQ